MSGLSGISDSMGLGGLADRVGSVQLLSGGNSVDEHRAFQDVLGVARGYDANETQADREARALEGAEKLIASVFLEPLLKSARESSQAAEPFAPTSGEKQFRSLLDARVAESVVHRSDMSLARRIAQDLLRAGGSGKGEVGK